MKITSRETIIIETTLISLFSFLIARQIVYLFLGV